MKKDAEYIANKFNSKFRENERKKRISVKTAISDKEQIITFPNDILCPDAVHVIGNLGNNSTAANEMVK